MDNEPVSNEVDYMHPEGKPAECAEPDDSLWDHKPDLKSYRYALEEADGHFMYRPDPFLESE